MVSVPGQAEHLLAMLATGGSGQWASFSELVADCTEVYRDRGALPGRCSNCIGPAVAFEQSTLGALQVDR